MTRTNEFGQPVGEPVPGWQARPPVEPESLVGRYVRLERLTTAHAKPLHKPMVLESPPSTWTYYPHQGLEDPGRFRAYVDGLLALPAAWPMAVVLPPGEPVGVSCFLRLDPPNGSVEVGGIVYAASLRRTPAATEATYLMLHHAFDDLGYRRFEWKCDSLNEPSRRAAERLGFTYEGTFRNAMVYRGRNRDTAWFSITDDEWPRMRAALEAWLQPDNFDAAGRQVRSLGGCRSAVEG